MFWLWLNKRIHRHIIIRFQKSDTISRSFHSDFYRNRDLRHTLLHRYSFGKKRSRTAFKIIPKKIYVHFLFFNSRTFRILESNFIAKNKVFAFISAKTLFFIYSFNEKAPANQVCGGHSSFLLQAFLFAKKSEKTYLTSLTLKPLPIPAALASSVSMCISKRNAEFARI